MKIIRLTALFHIALLWTMALPPPVMRAFQDFEAEKLRIASSQHEIIQILLKEKNLEAVFPEVDKILGLGLAAEHEDKITIEIRLISDAFRHYRRLDLSVRILERGIEGVTQPKSKSALYQELGYVYRLQGNNVKAMECFRMAQQLERRPTTRP